MSENGPSTGAGTSQDEDTTADKKAAKKTTTGSMRTRIGAAWGAVAVAVIVLVLILVFILQNQQEVRVSFIGAHGHIPLGILVLLSAAGGALLVVVLGLARMIQLRWFARQERRAARKSRSR